MNSKESNLFLFLEIPSSLTMNQIFDRKLVLKDVNVLFNYILQN